MRWRQVGPYRAGRILVRGRGPRRPGGVLRRHAGRRALEDHERRHDVDGRLRRSAGHRHRRRRGRAVAAGHRLRRHGQQHARPRRLSLRRRRRDVAAGWPDGHEVHHRPGHRPAQPRRRRRRRRLGRQLRVDGLLQQRPVGGARRVSHRGRRSHLGPHVVRGRRDERGGSGDGGRHARGRVRQPVERPVPVERSGPDVDEARRHGPDGERRDDRGRRRHGRPARVRPRRRARAAAGCSGPTTAGRRSR